LEYHRDSAGCSSAALSKNGQFDPVYPCAENGLVDLPQLSVDDRRLRTAVEIIHTGKIRAHFEFVVPEVRLAGCSHNAENTANRLPWPQVGNLRIRVSAAFRINRNNNGIIARHRNWIDWNRWHHRRPRHKNRITCKNVVDIFQAVGCL